MNKVLFSFLIFLVIIDGYSQVQEKYKVINYCSLDSISGPIQIMNFHRIENFNSFHSLELTDVLSKNCTFILAFKSANNREKDLMCLYSGKEIIKFKNNFVEANKDTIFKLSDPTDGSIISYLFEFNNLKRKNGISCKNFLKTADSTDALLEFYYFPFRLTEEERGAYESALSIKYGISLSGNAMYYNSAGDTIWNSLINKGFNNNVTGIGRDDKLNLYQKQSVNSNSPGISIGFNNIESLNEINNSAIEDQTYFIWGTDVNSQSYNKQNNFYICNKQWKYVNNLTTPQSLCIKATKDDIFLNIQPNDNEDYWMVTFDSISYSNKDLTFIPKTHISDVSVFFNYEIENQVKYFSFLIAPKIFVIYSIQPLCKGSNITTLKGKIIGGKGPYYISVDESSKVVNQTNDNTFEFDNLLAGTYYFTVTDAIGNVYSEFVEINTEKNSKVIDSILIMEDDGVVKITPDITDKNVIEYSWSGPNGFIAGIKDISVNIPGEYILTTTDSKGCQSKYHSIVGNANCEDEIRVYPNPVYSGNNFNIEIRAKGVCNIIVKIIDNNGKIVEQIESEEINFLQLSRKLLVKGNYYLDIEAGNNHYIHKLIVI